MRRQDRVARSLHSTAIRAGYSWANRLPAADPGDHYYDYLGLLTKWSEVFGTASLVPRALQPGALVGGDLLHDFLSVCGLTEHWDSLTVPPRQNEALSTYTTHIMDVFNRTRMDEGGHSPFLDGFREVLIAELDRTHPGRPWMPRRQEAIDFAAAFADSNRAVAETWFGGELFDEDFSEYPELDEAPAVDCGEVVGIITRMLVRYACAHLIVAKQPVEDLLADLHAEADLFRELATIFQGSCPRTAFRLIDKARDHRPDGPVIRHQWERLRQEAGLG